MAESGDGLMLSFESPCGNYILTFEDDGKVAYAYLKKEGDIVGAVWLYNRCPTPDRSEWADPGNIPFANCQGYMSEEGRLQRVVDVQDVLVDWQYDGDEPDAYVYVHEELYAVAGVDDHPGYARFAIKDSPLARVMEIIDD